MKQKDNVVNGTIVFASMLLHKSNEGATNLNKSFCIANILVCDRGKCGDERRNGFFGLSKLDERRNGFFGLDKLDKSCVLDLNPVFVQNNRS